MTTPRINGPDLAASEPCNPFATLRQTRVYGEIDAAVCAPEHVVEVAGHHPGTHQRLALPGPGAATLIIGKGLHQFLSGIHDERTMLNYRFIYWLTLK